MENYIEKLDELIALKKTKGHKITKKESEEFVSAWTEMISAEGSFSETAEQYFYDGFIFAGAKPFVKWVMRSEDKYSALDSLFKGSIYGKDTGATFRVLISSLAQIIIENPADINLICPLIKRIPSSSKNKENKTIGDGHRVVLKYFVNEIGDISVLPCLSELNLKQVYINNFISVFDNLLSKLDANALSKKDFQTLARINIWLHPNTVEGSLLKKDSEQEQTKNEGQNEKTSASVAQQDHYSLHPKTDPYDQLSSILNEALSLSKNLRDVSKNSELKCADLLETVDRLQREVGTLNERLLAANQRESSFEEQLTDRNNQVLCLNLKIKSLEETIQELSLEIEAKDQEIGQRIQMMDALSRDRAKQSDEQLHRLASKLRVEYRDFRDAESLIMDCDLGENMREQLKNVFSILIKAGISLD